MQLEDVLRCIKEKVDPEELVDILGLTTEELCEYLAEEINSKIERFEDIYEENYTEDYE